MNGSSSNNQISFKRGPPKRRTFNQNDVVNNRRRSTELLPTRRQLQDRVNSLFNNARSRNGSKVRIKQARFDSGGRANGRRTHTILKNKNPKKNSKRCVSNDTRAVASSADSKQSGGPSRLRPLLVHKESTKRVTPQNKEHEFMLKFRYCLKQTPLHVLKKAFPTVYESIKNSRLKHMPRIFSLTERIRRVLWANYSHPLIKQQIPVMHKLMLVRCV